jgi:G3E family GTPase
MSQLPVTVLSGFLGAGKTSLIRHLLAQPHGLRIAVLVNDLAAVNIDGRLITGFNPGAGPGPAALVELSNGCICCSLRDDLVAEVARLAGAGRFDHLLIESTGVSEPLPVAEAFTFADGAGRPLLESAALDTLVTVVDARGFLDDLGSIERLRERGMTANGDDERHLAELLVEQAETANVLVVNKTDLVSPGEAQALAGLLRQLNPTAELLFCTHGQVPADRVMGTGTFSFDGPAGLLGWLARLRGA